MITRNGLGRSHSLVSGNDIALDTGITHSEPCEQVSPKNMVNVIWLMIIWPNNKLPYERKVGYRTFRVPVCTMDRNGEHRDRNQHRREYSIDTMG